MSYNKTIIQIGAYIGDTKNDPIFNTIDQNTRVILIEPVPHYFELLQNNYKTKYPNHKHLIFINKAISTSSGYIELYIPSLKNDFSQFPSFIPQLVSIYSNHIPNHKLRNPNINYEDLIMETITVPTTTINDIINEYHINELFLLNIDTEGHDYEILMNYDFKVKPSILIFEHSHMDGITFLGPNYQYLKNKLESFDYFLLSVDQYNATFSKKINLSNYL